MAIPEGYRLLTSEDVGKTFGVDLESAVYFDTSVTPYTFKSDTPYTNFLSNYYVSIEGYYENAIRLYTGTDFWSESYNWYMDSYTFTEDVEITSFNTDYEWNTWFYVKDYVDPYNITLTKPKLTVKCANATMEKDLVVQAKVYDGTVEGGEAGSGSGTQKFNYAFTYASMNGAQAFISIDGDDPIESYGGYEGTGQANIIVLYSVAKLVSYTATPTTSAKFIYKAFGSSDDPCVLIIKLLEDNADIHIEGQD